MKFKEILRRPFFGISLVILLLSIDLSESNETTEQRKFESNLLKYCP